MKDFKECVVTNPVITDKITALRNDVESFSRQFPMPGFEER